MTRKKNAQIMKGFCHYGPVINNSSKKTSYWWTGCPITHRMIMQQWTLKILFQPSCTFSIVESCKKNSIKSVTENGVKW